MFLLVYISTLLLVFLLVFRCFYELLYEFYVMHVAPRLGWSLDLKKKYGDWAVVTGATDGIGKGIAFALVKKGINVVLIGRSASKLENVINELKALEKSVQLKAVVFDFAQSRKPSEAVEYFKKQLETEIQSVGILVNNVGIVGSLFACEFGNIPETYRNADEMVEVNIKSQLLLTSVLQPYFVKNQRGLIVTVSSMAAVHPAAFSAVYNATKAFNDFFSRSLRQELRLSNVDVETIYPGFVKTKLVPQQLQDYLRCSCVAPPFMPFAQQCVETFGRLDETYGSCCHRLQAYLLHCVKCIPVRCGDKLMRKMFGFKKLAVAVGTDGDKKTK